jgi:hypothetical protein
MLFIFTVGWNLVYWSHTFSQLRTIVDVVVAVDESESFGTKVLKFLQLLKTIICNPNMMATLAGIAIGLVSPVREALFHEQSILRPFGDAVQTLADPFIALIYLLTAASLAHAYIGSTTDEEETDEEETDMTTAIEKSKNDVENPIVSLAKGINSKLKVLNTKTDKVKGVYSALDQSMHEHRTRGDSLTDESEDTEHGDIEMANTPDSRDEYEYDINVSDAAESKCESAQNASGDPVMLSDNDKHDSTPAQSIKLESSVDPNKLPGVAPILTCVVTR